MGADLKEAIYLLRFLEALQMVIYANAQIVVQKTLLMMTNKAYNTRIVAYDRRTDGRHLTLSEWVEQKRRQFEAAHPEHRKRNGESRIAFDRWLERLK